jgi:hypothetical protein
MKDREREKNFAIQNIFIDSVCTSVYDDYITLMARPLVVIVKRLGVSGQG